MLASQMFIWIFRVFPNVAFDFSPTDRILTSEFLFLINRDSLLENPLWKPPCDSLDTQIHKGNLLRSGFKHLYNEGKKRQEIYLARHLSLAKQNSLFKERGATISCKDIWRDILEGNKIPLPLSWACCPLYLQADHHRSRFLLGSCLL